VLLLTLKLLNVTTAVRLPRVVGCVVKVTTKLLEVDAVTVPEAPLLKVTVLLAGVVEKPVLLMIIVGALLARYAVFVVTVGAVGALILAT
jgi:hypothetical protein